MTDHDYEATIETDDATYTSSGDRAMAVSAQVARMPVMVHDEQLTRRIDLDTPIWQYLEALENQADEQKPEPPDFPDREFGSTIGE